MHINHVLDFLFICRATNWLHFPACFLLIMCIPFAHYISTLKSIKHCMDKALFNHAHSEIKWMVD